MTMKLWSPSALRGKLREYGVSREPAEREGDRDVKGNCSANWPQANSESSRTADGKRHTPWVSDCDISTSTSWVSCLRSSRTPKTCTSVRPRSLEPSSPSSRYSGACTRPAHEQPTSRLL